MGTSSGSEFTALLIALCFHQFFEGFALGSTVVDANFKSRAITYMLVMAYAVTTPLGVGIGIAIHQSYNANSTQALLSQGILDALSAGILIYTGTPFFFLHLFSRHWSPYLTLKI